MIEALGYVASVIVLISFLMKDMKKLRILNSIACVMFVVYGISHNTFPVIAVNVMVIIINVYYLIKNK